MGELTVKYPKTTVGAIGFGYGAGYEAGFQGIAQESGVEQKKIDLDILEIADSGFEKWEIGLVGGFSAAAGIGGTVAAKTIGNVVKKVFKPSFTPVDRSQRSRKELLKELEEEGIDPDQARDPSAVETIEHNQKTLNKNKKDNTPIKWLDKDQEVIDVFVGNETIKIYKFTDEQLVEVEELVNKKLDEAERLSKQLGPSQQTPEQIRVDVEIKYANANKVKKRN